MKSTANRQPRVWGLGFGALTAFALGIASAQTQEYKADALLSVELNRSAVIEKINLAWQKEFPAASHASFKAKLGALRGDQLLAASLSGTFDGVLEVLADAPAASEAAIQPALGSAQSFYATRAEAQSALEAGRFSGFSKQTLAGVDSAKAVGELDKDLVFAPVAPCRLFDSRTGQTSALGNLGGVMLNQTTRTLAAGGTCDIPATGVRSIFLSFHSYNNNPAALGVITFQKTGAPVTGLAGTWTGGVWTTGTAITGTLDNGSFDVFVGNGVPMSADMVVDVMGYFTPANRGGDGLRVFGAGTGTPSVVNGNDDNSVGSAVGATVSGGFANQATGNTSTIGGGAGNRATGAGSVIAGGGYGRFTNCYNHLTTLNDQPCWNEAIGPQTAVVGGVNNRAELNAAFVGAGENNRASGYQSVVVGGVHNTVATGTYFGGIVAGFGNTISASTSFIGGGNRNSVLTESSVIAGGSLNSISGAGSADNFIGAGRFNSITGLRAVIVGGGSDGVNCFNRATGLVDATCPNRSESSYAFIGGGRGNRVSGSFASVTGGSSNEATGTQSVVVGGIANTASGDRAIVVGGGSTSFNTCFNRATGLNDGPCQNVASGVRSTIVGGVGNTASGQDAFVGAGSGNESSGVRSVALGGVANTASGFESVVPGGRSNQATGAFSFAAGRNARTNVSGPSSVSHFGAFVWADTPDDGSAVGSQGTAFRSTDNNQFAVRARGGIYFKTDNTSIAASATDATAGCALLPGGSASWSCSSDRNLKDGIKAISPKDVLSKVVNLPLSTWQFKGTNRRHLSPMAQDFWAAFGFGEDDRHISASDVSGVALAAVQGVNQKMNDELATLKAKNAQLQRSNASMMRELAAIKKKLGF